MVRYTSKTVIDPKQYIREIEKVREEEYYVDDEEYMPGVRAVAVPLITSSSPPAVLSVVGFTSTIDDQKLKTVIREIQGQSGKSTIPQSISQNGHLK